MPLDFSLLGPPLDWSARVAEGMELGRAMVHRQRQDNALAALGRNPEDPEAISALYSVNPQAAMQIQSFGQKQRETERAEQARREMMAAYNPVTGQIDPVRARAAYAGAGDLEGLAQFEAAQTELKAKLSKQQQDQFKLGARLLRGVKDEAGYQRARQMAAEAGVDLSEIPETFDPDYVAQVVQIGEVLESGGEEYTLSPGAIRMRGGEVIAQSPYAPTITADGVVYERQPSGPVAPTGSGGGGSSGQPRGVRNNNPGNIEDGPFAKSLPGYAGSDGRYARFATPEAGAAASHKLLGSYLERGFDTPAKIIGRWAPASENGVSTTNYTNYVSERLGIGPNEPVSPAMLPALAQAIREFETGQGKQGGGVRALTPKKKSDPSATRVLNGRTYYKIGGRWFDNPEGT